MFGIITSMVNTRSTKYEESGETHEHQETDSNYSDETDSRVSDSDSEYVPSDSESQDNENISRLAAATALLNLKEGSFKWSDKKSGASGGGDDSDSDYYPGDDSGTDDDEDDYEDEYDHEQEYVGGIKALRGMPTPCGVHIRFD